MQAKEGVLDDPRGALDDPPGVLNKPRGGANKSVGVLTEESTNLIVGEAEEDTGPVGARVSILAHPHLHQGNARQYLRTCQGATRLGRP